MSTLCIRNTKKIKQLKIFKKSWLIQLEASENRSILSGVNLLTKNYHTFLFLWRLSALGCLRNLFGILLEIWGIGMISLFLEIGLILTTNLFLFRQIVPSQTLLVKLNNQLRMLVCLTMITLILATMWLIKLFLMNLSLKTSRNLKSRLNKMMFQQTTVMMMINQLSSLMLIQQQLPIMMMLSRNL